jgi:major membrane immunogen (membrane-anchored lipoprotein)
VQNNATVSNQTETTSSDIFNVASPTFLDGTYVLERFDEVKTLTIKDGTGQLETKKYDEKIDIDSVKVNVNKQIILIGDDMKTYQLDGNQLTLTEGDGSQDIYTKQ